MKRFWKTAEVAADGSGWTIALDGRPVRTPARALLQVDSEPLAHAIAAEWQDSGEQIDPRAMPLTGLANAAIDRVQTDRDGFGAGLARYAETDLLTYRAATPRALVERETAAWDPLLHWARRRYDVDFTVTDGISHVAQPPATVSRLAHAVAALDAFQLAGLSALVTISGSLVAGLAVLEGGAEPKDAWAAVTVDERFQLETWGMDAEAEAALENRRRDFLAGARFLQLLKG